MDDVATEHHWRGVYSTKDATSVSWFQPSPEPSLRMISKTDLPSGARILDAGGGASSLVDELLSQGFRMTVLDIADEALAVSQARLGARAAEVTWVASDITTWRPSGQFDLWHDRAVFHFLTAQDQRDSYIEVLKASLVEGGWLVMATFAPTGPEKCSGLPVHRWSATDLAVELGDAFRLIESSEEIHETPWASQQAFTWALFQRVG